MPRMYYVSARLLEDLQHYLLEGENLERFLDNHVDVNDGSDGQPVPNTAMRLQSEREALAGRLEDVLIPQSAYGTKSAT